MGLEKTYFVSETITKQIEHENEKNISVRLFDFFLFLKRHDHVGSEQKKTYSVMKSGRKTLMVYMRGKILQFFTQ